MSVNTVLKLLLFTIAQLDVAAFYSLLLSQSNNYFLPPYQLVLEILLWVIAVALGCIVIINYIVMFGV